MSGICRLCSFSPGILVRTPDHTGLNISSNQYTLWKNYSTDALSSKEEWQVIGTNNIIVLCKL